MAAQKVLRYKVHLAQVTKLFSLGDHRSMTKKSTKKLYSSSGVYFVRNNA